MKNTIFNEKKSLILLKKPRGKLKKNIRTTIDAGLARILRFTQDVFLFFLPLRLMEKKMYQSGRLRRLESKFLNKKQVHSCTNG